MTTINKNNMMLSENLRGKEVVVDTSVLLDVTPSILTEFENCRFIIPVVVIDELEEKRSHPTLGYFARSWLHFIEGLRVERDKDTIISGVEVPETNNVSVAIEINHISEENITDQLRNGSNDSRIMAVAKNLQIEEKDKANNNKDYAPKTVAILSRDLPMRLNATMRLDLEAYDLPSQANPFSGVYNIYLTDDEIEKVYAKDPEINNVILNKLPEGHATSAIIRVNEDKKMDLVMTNMKIEHLNSSGRIKESKNINIVPRTIEQKALVHFLNKSAEELPVVSAGGSAGTGKTMITIAAALAQINDEKSEYRKLMIFRSLHEMGNKQELGFLPGTVEEKMAPWAGAIDDAIESIARISSSKNGKSSAAEVEKIKKILAERVEIQPITYLRGRSIPNVIMVIEEAQNFSSSELLNILSRAGEGSKIVLTFDAAQVDNKYLRTGDNADVWVLIDKLKNKGVAAHVTLTKTERSKVAEVASAILEKR